MVWQVNATVSDRRIHRHCARFSPLPWRRALTVLADIREGDRLELLVQRREVDVLNDAVEIDVQYLSPIEFVISSLEGEHGRVVVDVEPRCGCCCACGCAHRRGVWVQSRRLRQAPGRARHGDEREGEERTVRLGFTDRTKHPRRVSDMRR